MGLTATRVEELYACSDCDYFILLEEDTSVGCPECDIELLNLGWFERSMDCE